jgi:hypothetical protein
MALLMVFEDVLAVRALRPEVSSGDENTQMDGESCAGAAKCCDEGDS